MRESRPYGSERGAFSNGRPYRNRTSDLRSAGAAYGATIWERRVNQDEKKQPGVGMIVACGGLGKA
jgi:hypothetical protein